MVKKGLKILLACLQVYSQNMSGQVEFYNLLISSLGDYFS